MAPMDDRRVGRVFREVRIALGWRQTDLGARAGVSQSQISALESGRIEHVSLNAIRRIGDALDIRVSIDPWWRSGRIDRLLDRAHAALVEHTVRTLREAGWEVRVEYTFNEYGDRGSVDVLAWHADTATLAIIEIKSRIDDVQDTAASFMRKVRIVPKVVARDEGWQPTTVSRVLVLADTHQNRDLVERHRATFDTIWPERTVAVTRHLKDPDSHPLRGGIRFVEMPRPITTTRAA